MQAEAYHRVSDTGDNATDFMLARERSPGAVSVKADLSKPAKAIRGDLRISEIVDMPNWVVSFYFPRCVFE